MSSVSLTNEYLQVLVCAGGLALSPADSQSGPATIRIELPGAMCREATIVECADERRGKGRSLVLKHGDRITKKGSAPSLQQSKEGAEISSWNNPEAPVSWSFSGLKPGHYEVLAEVSGLETAKTIVELGAAAPILSVDVSGIKKEKSAEQHKLETLAANLAATGDYKKFELQNLGQIRIAGNGEWNLTIRPDPSAWKAFNLRKVMLRPVAEN